MSTPSGITFDFEGHEIRCAANSSVAAALAGSGEYALREAGDGEQRGVFCGIGVCQECVVDVDGRGRVRACMTAAEDGLKVRRAPRLARAAADENGEAGVAASGESSPDVLIIGGGAAGLTAAAMLADQDVNVVLLDERKRPGGQYYKQPFIDGDPLPGMANDAQIREGGELVERARTSGAQLVAAAEIWGVFGSGEVMAMVDGKTRTYRPRATIVATGAFERGLPLPGWTLPGVMTSGAAQTMLKSYAQLPGKRVLVTGNGPLNLQIADELARAGADVVAVTELAPSVYRRPGAALSMLRHDAALTMRGLRTLRSLKAAGVPVLFGHGLAAVEQTESGLRAHAGGFDGRSVARERTFDVDVVCMGFGFLPNNEILRSFGCQHEFDDARGQMTVVRSAGCETSVPGVYAIGDCCGLGGAPAACEEGRIVAAAVVRSLGRKLPPMLTDEEAAARRRLASHRHFQAALWRLFEAPRLQSELADADTVVCRCERVTVADIRAAIEAGDTTIGAIKRRTRLGMGPCQARYCAPVAASVLAEATGTPVGEYSYFAPRVPIKPVRIADLAATSAGDERPTLG
jgi:thioredoxin reductase/bacterioferritin-associated ferredoxin